MDWFLYDRDLFHERDKQLKQKLYFYFIKDVLKAIFPNFLYNVY